MTNPEQSEGKTKRGFKAKLKLSVFFFNKLNNRHTTTV